MNLEQIIELAQDSHSPEYYNQMSWRQIYTEIYYLLSDKNVEYLTKEDLEQAANVIYNLTREV
jgi:hypothetical protein